MIKYREMKPQFRITINKLEKSNDRQANKHHRYRQ